MPALDVAQVPLGLECVLNQSLFSPLWYWQPACERECPDRV